MKLEVIRRWFVEEVDAFLDETESTELGASVTDGELACLEDQESVHPGHGDIEKTHIYILTSTLRRKNKYKKEG